MAERDVTPTRSAVLELEDERRAMHEGYVFLDEKCLLLAGEMLRELARCESLQRAFRARWDAAVAALQAAVARHGLEGLQVHPPAGFEHADIRYAPRALMGVRLQEAELRLGPQAAPPAVDRSPEVEACRRAFARIVGDAVELAAVGGNLERLSGEYRRAVRRARALHDVLLPEIDRDVREIATRLEEIEQEDAIWMRPRPA
jgi:V/A-type H+-transporting ATPase subunit D